MSEQRTSGHTVSRLTVHIVWSTKYRYAVLKGDIQIRCRTLLMQIYDPEDMNDITKKLRYSLLDRTNSIYEFNEDISEINDRANYDRHLDVPFLKDHVKHPKIVDKLTDILGENVLCWRSEWFTKYVGDNGTNWHQA